MCARRSAKGKQKMMNMRSWRHTLSLVLGRTSVSSYCFPRPISFGSKNMSQDLDC